MQIIAEKEIGDNLTVLDIGTGSGCIAISLASLLNDADVYATDISVSAISLAKKIV